VLVRSLPRWLSQADPVPGKALLTGLLGLRPLLGFLIECLISTTFMGLGALLLFLILRLVTRRDVLAAALIVGILLASAVSGGEVSLWFVLPIEIALFGSFLVLLLRVGVLSAIAGLFVFDVLSAVPLSFEFDRWTGSAAAVVMPLLIVLAVLAFRIALGGSTGLRQWVAAEAGSRP